MSTLLDDSQKKLRLNDLQISVLRLFDQNLSDQDTFELRQLLMNYFDKQLKTELDEVFKTKDYTQGDFEQMLIDDNFAIK